VRISVLGLGRLGFPLFNVLARAGYEMVGIDPKVSNWPVVAEEHRIIPPTTTEPGLEFPDGILGRCQFAPDPQPADVNFIVVPTPSLDKGDHAGGFDSAYVETALRHIRNVNKPAVPIAVIISTLSPGTCDRLEQQFQETVRIVYNPTFIALGNVVKGLTRPDLLLIGGNDDGARGVVKRIWFRVFKEFGHSREEYYLHWSSFTEVELIKLAVNAALGTKISVANSLGELFAAYGVSPKAVEVIGHDPRIGTALMSPGSPISGPCLPRDNRALQVAATRVGVNLPLSVATDRVNWLLLDSIRNRVLACKPASVGILGLSYKYGIDVDTAAPGPWLMEQMKKEGIVCFGYDELIPRDSLEETLNADLIVVTQKEYRPLLEGTTAQVVDLWE
jgi:UDPglucose 6-dehydrogenase